MKFLFSFFLCANAFPIVEMNLSKEVYEPVKFSSQFLDEGAMIRNVNYKAVNQLVAQIEALYNIKLEDRGEAHITVLTPPEAQGWFTDHKGVNFLISPIELHKRYFNTLQATKFEVLCLGEQTNDSGNRVFYLVVEKKNSDILKVREEIQAEVEQRARFTNMKTHFKSDHYWPHITVGYVGGDVHGVNKGPKSCISDVRLKIQ